MVDGFNSGWGGEALKFGAWQQHGFWRWVAPTTPSLITATAMAGDGQRE